MEAHQEYVDEFFRAPRLPANTHEEWLLRMCSQLMDREARIVSVMEAAHRHSMQQVATEEDTSQNCEPRPSRGRRRRGGGGANPPPPPQNSSSSFSSSWTPSSNGLDASTNPSTGTGTTSWGES